MYKVLIADDEVKVCKLIQNIVDWKALGLVVIGTAHDGIAALEIIRNEKPDILITDIRMPGHDGIKLIELAKELSPTMCFVIISGYRQFDYARSAIRFGVEDYLLKPLDEVELVEILTKMVQKLEGIRKTGMNRQKRMETDASLIRQAFMEYLIREPTRLPEAPDMHEINLAYHCHFQEGYFQVLVIKADILDKRIGREAHRLLSGSVRKLGLNELGPGSLELLSLETSEGVYFLANMDEEYKKELRKKLKQIRSEASALRDLFYDIKATAGMGACVNSFSMIHESVRGARRSILNRLFFGLGHTVDVNADCSRTSSLNDTLDHHTRSRLRERIEVLDTEGVQKLLELIRQRTAAQKDMDGELLLEISQELIDILMFELKKLNSEISSDKFRHEFMESFYMCVSPEDVFEQIWLIYYNGFREVLGAREQTSARPVRIAKKYIQDHYNEPLKLEEVSRMAGFNSTYFSGLFKKETGERFSDYLISVRINKAKHLLIEGNASVEDVAESVGYSELKYFSKLFKKTTGLNPTEFRKLYRRLD